MKVMHILTLAFLIPFSLTAQTAGSREETPPFSTNEGTLVGAGRYNIRNSYISDDINYTGWGLQLLNERMRNTSRFNRRLSVQQMFYVDLSSTLNPAKTISELSGFAEYSYGYHYRFQPAPQLKLLAGAAVHGLFGFLYNTQGSNNPFALNVDADFSLSAAAIYSFRLRDFPLTLRYQADMPLVGAAFSPGYEQSYYEIFGLGNYSGIVHFTSLHNKFSMRSFLTLDFPVSNCTVRIGCLSKLYYSDINRIEMHRVSHGFMIGLAKEFVSFGGKRLKNKHLYQSAFY
ncbi:MAG: DUF3316 domain-containing protein [Tannerella sp.]|jgi:hypothetical protein|nr:DUF3316 domain-containing protein [Tannerella sp.]